VKGFAQIGTPLSQFSGNQIVYNPGYAGIYDLLSINLTVHKSWIQIPGSPQLINLNAHAPFRNQRHAMGLVLQNEAQGPLQGNFALANYAYKMYFGRSVLSFGVQAGVMVHTINWNKITYVTHENDPYKGEGRVNEAKFDAGVGAYYLAPQWYLGFSVRHLNNPKYNFTKKELEDTKWYSEIVRPEFIMIGGYNIQANREWSFRPEAFVRYVHNTPLSVNAGVHAYYVNTYGIGINYLTGQKGVSFQAKAMFGERFRIGYSYDVFFGDLRPYQRGSHEISINYLIRDIWGSKVRTVDLLWL
jgi:type IX secretion system PorP/SprF family membrane protein